MADFDFETHLSRAFAEPPPLRDSEQFAQRVAEKLDRGWALRRVLIGATGVLAGVVAAGQMITTRFAGELRTLSDDGARKLDLGLDKALTRYGDFLTAGSSETLWLVALMALVALTFVVMRAVEEF
jgi:hypothetical protein